ncbi:MULTISPECIES: roadblock/LC7 domain-containing protein [Streptomyces]|jgi:predicted regulator of Ras-like GTPase activity (Roadblock/LC7/MglB family)|uniref:roadblock/LC7 domain-containing protein n=1 Tax=Streptomyces TaxID=1883 RepID=UPI001908E5A4|nr:MULTISPECIES: roadblock/LC7 domain-containing protein [unclassified Streptomyces]MCU4747141.1 roadblock/LC7 domain-containing protein [Streptomyces sp. G-5]QQN77791.1 roadblock/LC7 domain-containing protein [Streptomyces sp. XC 2026]
MQYVESPERQSWMISEVSTVPGVRHVIVFSSDGLLLACSEGIDRDSADRLSANCSGLQSLGRSLGRDFGEEDGAVNQQMVDFRGGYLFMRSAAGTHLAAVTGPVVDPGLVAQRMQAQILRIAAVRPGGGPPPRGNA